MDKPKEVINSEKIISEMQTKVVTLFHALSDKSFNDEVNWVRPAGGGGKSITIINEHIEKAACNFSSITDVKLPSASLASKINNSGIGRFYATGLSVISHPINPKVPTSHLNIRIFKIFDKKGNLSDFWCGGGYDLTPYIPFKADTNLWHKNAKNCLDTFNKNFYHKFSKNCDEYFFLPHRNEKRGIGGIFFDSLKLKNIDKCLELLISVAESYISSYQEICLKRMGIPYSDDEKIFQEYRRSRYVEFNLLHDRGTKFGIESGGRADSILASLPPSVLWPPFKDQNMKTMERKLLKHLNQNWKIK